jgi:CBS domain containing-hemolysin-like protein
MEIDTINEHLPFKIPKGDYETLAGFLLQHFQRIPKAGEMLEHDGMVFKIIEADGKSIKKVEVARKQVDDNRK